MPSTSVAARDGVRWGRAVVLAGALSPFALGATALADQPPPGNAGTVKVHRATTSDDDRRNEPKVCAFRLVGFGFPDDAELVIEIEGHGGPNAGPDDWRTSLGAGDLSPKGDWAIAGPSLADGMYKLSVDNTTAPGGAKHKVFKVECGEVGGTTGGDTTGGTTDAGSTTDGTTGTTTDGTTGSTTDGSTTDGSTTDGITTGGTPTDGTATDSPTGGDTTGGTTGAGSDTTTGGVASGVARPTQGGAEVLGATVVPGGDALPATGTDVSALVLPAVGLLGLGGAALAMRRPWAR